MPILIALLATLCFSSAQAAEFAPILTDSGSLALDPHTSDIEKIVVIAGAKLLGRPYVGGKLGEGAQGEYDQDPLYRLDVFDCTTYVETVLANAFCNDQRNGAVESCLRSTMQKIRYFDDSESFESRNHIAETDWLASNIRRGFLRDVTAEIGGSSTRYSRVVTDKRGWFAARTVEDIQTSDDAATKNRKLSVLRGAGENIAPVQVAVPYLGFDLLFRETSRGLVPNEELYRRLPNGGVFNVVRENWNPPGSGTALAISHQGFIVQKSDGTYLRHASTDKSVLEMKLGDYMIQYVNSSTIRGLNVLAVQPKP